MTNQTGRTREHVLSARRIPLILLFLGCASQPRPTRYSDSRPPTPPATLGALDEGMPDPSLRKGNSDEDTDGPNERPSRANMDPLEPGWLGVELAARGEGKAGALVVDVVRRSPAAAVGLAAGDVILQFEGQAVSDPLSFIRKVRANHPGSKASLGILRSGQTRLVVVEFAATPTPDELLERRFVGAPAPPLDRLTMVVGDAKANWTALRGQLVILEFSSPWCGVCQLMHQRMNEWQAQWAPHGVTVIGIAPLGPDAARSYATRFGIGFSVAADEAEDTFRSYDVFAVPSLFLVDRRGTIVDATTGYSSVRLAQMEKKLISLIGQGGG